MSKTLSEAETEIMRIIWNSGGSISSTELTRILEKQEQGWKRTTVSTFLSRLCDKGMLRSERCGRAYTYTALATEEEYSLSQAKDFVRKMYKGDAKGLVAALIESDFLSAGDMAELHRFWNGEDGDK